MTVPKGIINFTHTTSKVHSAHEIFGVTVPSVFMSVVTS